MPQFEITIYLPNMFMKKQDVLVPTRRNKEKPTELWDPTAIEHSSSTRKAYIRLPQESRIHKERLALMLYLK